MSDLFPRAKFWQTGYHLAQVDAFFDRARAAYDRPILDDASFSAIDVRRVAFDLKRGGYRCAPVDSALDRLEIAFGSRTKDEFVRAHGHDAWMAQLAHTAQSLYPRLRRPAGERFRAPTKASQGYDAREVDALLNRLIAFFDRGEPLTADELRTATFKRRGKRGGYDEHTVDAFLARAVDVLLGAQ